MTVELSKSRENLVDLAKELDIKVGLIYRWRREILDKGEGSFLQHFPGGQACTFLFL